MKEKGDIPLEWGRRISRKKETFISRNYQSVEKKVLKSLVKFGMGDYLVFHKQS